MPTYRLKKNRLYIGEDGIRMEAGDTLEMSKEEFKTRNLHTHFDPITSEDEDTDSGDHGATGTSGTHRGGTGGTRDDKSLASGPDNSTNDSNDSKFSAISGMSVEEVKNLIESLDTEEDLELLRKEELSGKKRKGVIEAIDAALED